MHHTPRGFSKVYRVQVREQGFVWGCRDRLPVQERSHAFRVEGFRDGSTRHHARKGLTGVQGTTGARAGFRRVWGVVSG